MSFVSIQKVPISDIRRVINKRLAHINSVIEKRKPLGKIGTGYSYIVDALNVEGGSLNKFRKTKKLLESYKNKRILIIARSRMRMQTADEKNSCLDLVKSNKKITILYIHTHVIVDKKVIPLLGSCKSNSDYCTKYESKSSINSKRLCVTPILKIMKRRPVHDVCEIDDLMVFYYALCNPGSKILSKTEKYHIRFDKNSIHHLKLFLNIPVTLYNKKSRNAYIDPIKLLPKYLTIYNENKFTGSRNINRKID